MTTPFYPSQADPSVYSPRWVKKQIHGIQPAMNFTNEERRFIT